MKLSVIMSVYKNDSPQFLEEAFTSLLCQSYLPDEVVVVKDGLLTAELDEIVEGFGRHGFVNVIPLPANVGLGNALNIAIAHATGDFVARMDSDDISLPDRFQRQVQFLRDHPDVDVVSSFVGVYSGSEVLYVRSNPTDHDSIKKLAKYRFPMNHPASILRKSIVVKAGNYIEVPQLEDYFLWVRMLVAGAKMASIPEVLYLLRTDDAQIGRRRGLNRVFLFFKLQCKFYDMEFINSFELLRNILIRTVACLMPVPILKRVRLALKY